MPEATVGGDADDVLLRQRILHGARTSLPATDGLTALLLLLVAAAPHWRLPGVFAHPELEETLRFALMAEGSFLMLQWSLVDIAARMTKRPPLWMLLAIAAGLIVIYPESRLFILQAWERGAIVMLPLVLSLVQRFAILWTLPARPLVEKMAADALVQNRVFTALGLFGGLVLLLVLSRVVPAWSFLDVNEHRETFLLLGAVYFGIAAFDDRRVRTKAFAERPRILFQKRTLQQKDYVEEAPPAPVRAGRLPK